MKGKNFEKEAGQSWKRNSLCNKVKLIELHLFDELDDFEMFFHGTSHENATAVIDGIDGGPRMEFSHGDGFYLVTNMCVFKETKCVNSPW